jgi:hypothetical protein
MGLAVYLPGPGCFFEFILLQINCLFFQNTYEHKTSTFLNQADGPRVLVYRTSANKPPSGLPAAIRIMANLKNGDRVSLSILSVKP